MFVPIIMLSVHLFITALLWDSWKALAECLGSHVLTYVKVFCVKGAGTKDDALIRVIVTRCEVDMVQIKQEFQRLHGRPLESFIEVQILSFDFLMQLKDDTLGCMD